MPDVTDQQFLRSLVFVLAVESASNRAGFNEIYVLGIIILEKGLESPVETGGKYSD